jgi:hypothetical protein
MSESKRLPKGSRVAIRTTNGGFVVGTLSADYVPTYRVEIDEAALPIPAERLLAVDPLPDAQARALVDPCWAALLSGYALATGA